MKFYYFLVLKLILINNLETNFQVMMNEPKFIIDLNKRIYKLIIEDIKQKELNHKMISIINGNFTSYISLSIKVGFISEKFFSS